MNLNEENAITKKINWLRQLEEKNPEYELKRRNIFPNYISLLNSIEECIKLKNGYKMNQILKLTQIPIYIYIIDNMNENDLRKKIKERNSLKSFEQLIIDHFNIIKILCNKNNINWDMLSSISCKFLSTFLQLYCNNLWLLPYLLSICSFLNNISTLADSYNNNKNDIFSDENEDINNKNKYTIEVLNSIRGKIGIVKGDAEKHGGFVILMLQSIKLCMKLNNMQITSSFLKIINSTDINYAYIPKLFIVLFKCQLGKLYLQKMEYEKAENEFIWAFSNSQKNKIAFRKKILQAIISIRLNKGIYPPKNLLKKYNLHIYIDIIYSMKRGNIFLYNNVIQNFSKYFFENGLNECIDQIHFIVKRNLLKIIVDWWNQIIKDNPNKVYKVPISLFHHIFIWAGITQHHYYLETLCIITSLILFRYINAYISYDNNILVLSKNDPFPLLSQPRVSR
ncbi:PCI domain-containing protein, putative [Plasmodium berghei]|uniref:PCI domain-containing protein, putative n=2 Tax=Plasmodium berghei TaxID=5821 RepID=A0A509AGZ2_PLABA|nr:PCI domain-containing protein, putative [Plasmodium berghei ANKA]CXH92553.1 PCI domain-containing protein, putative [Plasmodium berghei]SCL90683.1 PCI domain-containing protein, putative [Plasmodium berghei]SCM15331.1 PCI domain-containing protein, putative [Plasmodium berghei]SCM17124.1 PCI domain-containing protein, putative [Plasmodium berghei]SCN22116.1 PCI domain-containing protein, putative [Plasmodium berghei]|eukprot:XP_034419915.1 PCI domain-containing protein, putative [Plasmodium berghei ANKA]